MRITKASKKAIAAARAAVKHYWGETAGGEADLAAAEAIIREAGLSSDEFHDFRAELPIGAAGTTGQRVARIDRVLKRLEKASGQ
jgi:hypothetical protein